MKYHEAFEDHKYSYLVLEYCPGGELFSLIHKRATATKLGLNLKLTRYYAACIFLALEHLHNHNIVFNDLKPENIVISADGKAKLTDFGVSVLIDPFQSQDSNTERQQKL